MQTMSTMPSATMDRMFFDILTGIRALHWIQPNINAFFSADNVPAGFQAEQRQSEEKAIQDMLGEALVMWVTAFGQVRFFLFFL